MSDVRTRASEAGRKACEDLTRLYFLYVTHPTEETLDALVQCCLAILKRKIAYYVHAKRMYPSFLAPDTFAEDAFSLAVEKFWRGIHDLRNPKQLMAWLGAVAHSAVVEEFLSWIRRTKDGPIHWVEIEQEVHGDDD